MPKGKKSSKGNRTRLSVKKTPPKTIKLLGKKKGKGKTKRKNNVMKGGTMQCDCDEIDKTLRNLLKNEDLISSNTLPNDEIIKELNKAKVEGGGNEALQTALETANEAKQQAEQQAQEAKEALETAKAEAQAEKEEAVTQLKQAKIVLTPLLAKIDEDKNALKIVIQAGRDTTKATTTLDNAKDTLIDKLKEIIKEEEGGEEDE
jgi:hypothetical protein